jgi:hypothetical protein
VRWAQSLVSLWPVADVAVRPNCRPGPSAVGDAESATNCVCYEWHCVGDRISVISRPLSPAQHENKTNPQRARIS